MPLHHQKDYILFVFLAIYPIYSDAIDFTQCFADVISCTNSNGCALNISGATALSILRTSDGFPVASTSTATALSYTGCSTYCGAGPQSFSWITFAQQYSAWLLPYLALLSQLPFGARRRMDNLMSVVLTLGSPTLAGYSLYMTFLDARWVNDRLFSGIEYPSATVRRSVVRVLSNLQQVPLRIHPGESARFESLVVHPANDKWWTILAKELDYTRTWSIASAMSIIWVIIAYMLAAAYSITNVSENIQSSGQGIGSGWLWLLPIVVGWLVLSPKCDYDRVHDAYRKANRRALAADVHEPTAAPTRVTSDFGLTITSSPDWMFCGTNVTSPDELRIPPIFNYARMFSWARDVYRISLFYRAACRKWNRRIGVDGNRIPRSAGDHPPRESRLGTREETIRYCRPDDSEYDVALLPPGLFSNMIVASLMALQLQWGTTGAAILALYFTPTVGLACRSLVYVTYGTLSTMVWVLLVGSSALAYYAHHLVEDRLSLDLESARRHVPFDVPPTPPNSILTISLTDDDHGLAGESDAAIPLHIVKTLTGVAEGKNHPIHIDSDEPHRLPQMKYFHPEQIHARALTGLANWLRWIGKALAIINAVLIVANSVLQYAGIYNNCYCDSGVFTWGTAAFNVINPTSSDINMTRRAWIGGLGLALSCCGFFVGSMYLIRDSLPS